MWSRQTIQIQPMLRLNLLIVVTLSRFTLNSNTTNVKVKQGKQLVK